VGPTRRLSGAIIVMVTLIASLCPLHAAAEEPLRPGKPVSFEGYAITDSLDYHAESIRYLYDSRKIIMTGNAVIAYQGNTLKSHEIVFFQDYDYMEAVGRQDSTGALVDTPVFTDATGEAMDGDTIKYNIRTGKGYIIRGKTQYDNGFMAADRIKRAGSDTLYVANGTYTTCDLDHPHFYFAGTKMKFIINDKLIIKPIIAYINDIPVLWFPFYVFPIKKGRQSGFLTPRYGASRRDGRYVSSLGYYFAPSDKADYKFAGTLRERNGWLMKNWFNYNVQYKLSGSVFGSVEHRNDPSYDSQQWKLRASHRQTVSPTLSITGSGQFESSSYSQYNSSNLYERLNRDMRSTLSVRKQWRDSGNSLMTTMSYNKNLDTESTSLSLPNVSFRMPRKLLFGSESKNKPTRKYESTETGGVEAPKFYETFYYSFNAQFNNTQSSKDDKDTFNRATTLSTSLSSSQKLMGWLQTEPSVSLNENFTVSSTAKPENRYKRQDNLTGGLRLGTTVYGMFQPKIGSLTALRHVVNPSLSYLMGHRRIITGEGMKALFRFDSDDDGTGSNKTNSLRFNVRNIFQAKLLSGDKERKFDLFTLNFSSSVDFENEEKPIAPLQTTIDFRPRQGISTRLTATHDFYHGETFEPFSPFLKSLDVTSNFGLSPSRMGFLSTTSRDDANNRIGDDEIGFDTEDAADDADDSLSAGGFPINISLSHSYGIRRSTNTLTGGKYTRTHTVKPNLTMRPTRNLSIRYYCNYDIKDREMTYQRINISRDLHCWEASLSWIPSGRSEGFYFLANIKELPDVKVEKREGSSQVGY